MSDNKLPLTPFDLITNDLVKQTLRNDNRPEAEILSWETKDFTNKGDNYSSTVTSFTVKFKENGKIFEESYVAKLNPLRPSSSFADILETMYSHEATVLSEVLEGMNKQLANLNLSPIKAPKLYARSLEKGREAFVTENLRKQGFKMYDRTKGMDIKHALLVVEELGRFHASSLLFEETLFPKTIPEAFDYFHDIYTDINQPSLKMIDKMMNGQCKSSCSILKNVPNYEKCTKWLGDNIDDVGKFFIQGYGSSKPMEVLIHGDCWTNNMLFKYNEDGIPIDIRFVDLQNSIKSSPACDMNYFYYTSLTGEVRKKYMNILEKSYYNSFLSVLELAGKESPFTFSEFENEMMERKQFGLMAGMLVLPIILAEGDEIWEFDKIKDDNMEEFLDMQSSRFSLTAQREGPFKDRFLSMFDEMLEYKIFDN